MMKFKNVIRYILHTNDLILKRSKSKNIIAQGHLMAVPGINDWYFLPKIEKQFFWLGQPGQHVF